MQRYVFVALAFVSPIAAPVHAQHAAASAAAQKPPTRAEQLEALAVLVRMVEASSAREPAIHLMVATTTVALDIAGVPYDQVWASKQAIDLVVRELAAVHHLDLQPILQMVIGDPPPPEPVKSPCELKQDEARGNLKALYVCEESHRAEFDLYTTDQATIGFRPRGDVIRYRYEVLSASPTAFRARATGIGEMAGDVWEMTEANDLTNKSNACAAPPTK